MPHTCNSFKKEYWCIHLGLDRLFGVWNRAIQQINNWINMASPYRSSIFLNKVHVAFFNSEYFGEMTTRANEHLSAQFTLALTQNMREHYSSTMKVMTVVMTMKYQKSSSGSPISTQYHQQLKPPSTPYIIKNQQHPSLH